MSLEGWLLGGRYRLLSKLGEGGMGAVWRARDELLDREVAIKEVTAAGQRAADTMREARIAAKLTHPNIAAVHDVVLAGERPWIVMQYVPSSSLARMIADRGPLAVPTVTRIGLEVLAALRYAHASGVLHRDVKPGNILLTSEGHAILTDFGLATTLDGEPSSGRPGVVVGTPAYIAPERAGGGPSTALSDLWSLGATLYAAVEGRAPYRHSSELATLSAVVSTRPDPFERAGELAPLIGGLLEKDPERRTGAAEAHAQLTALLGKSEPAPPDRPTGGAAAQRTGRGRRWCAGGRRRETAGLLALAGIVVAATSWSATPVAGPPVPAPHPTTTATATATATVTATAEPAPETTRPQTTPSDAPPSEPTTSEPTPSEPTPSEPTPSEPATPSEATPQSRTTQSDTTTQAGETSHARPRRAANSSDRQRPDQPPGQARKKTDHGKGPKR
ncbi:protein kinase [Nonomuraea sp. NPDC049725]|uniref:serine/threonine-protein kinase n=1 Tax=Nonomuraea sp. NPDC049725 TaxID=3154508 RepID=UPI0034144E42